MITSLSKTAGFCAAVKKARVAAQLAYPAALDYSPCTEEATIDEEEEAEDDEDDEDADEDEDEDEEDEDGEDEDDDVV